MHFDHVALQVPDIDEAVAWYLDTIDGAEVRYRDATWALIEAGGTKLAFVVADQHPTHVAWRVGADRLDSLAKIHGAQIRTHRDDTQSFYLKDPGGHVIEFISYPEESPPS